MTIVRTFYAIYDRFLEQYLNSFSPNGIPVWSAVQPYLFDYDRPEEVENIIDNRIPCREHCEIVLVEVNHPCKF